MPRITVNPDAQSAGSFPAWKPGEYEVEIVDVQNEQTKTGKAQLVISLRATGEVMDTMDSPITSPQGLQLRDWVLVDPITTKNGGTVSFLRALVEAAGLSWADFDTEELLNKTVRLITEVDENGRTNVRRYLKKR